MFNLKLFLELWAQNCEAILYAMSPASCSFSLLSTKYSLQKFILSAVMRHIYIHTYIHTYTYTYTYSRMQQSE